MKASDLRIGNWASHYYKGIIKGWHEHQISHEDIYALAVGENDRYKPIPLTEEWLLKLGFDKQYYTCPETLSDINDGYILQIHIDDTSSYMKFYEDFSSVLIQGYKGFIPAPIKHVHQLQNLYYCLTGVELKLSE